jgi:hypothetical protein
MDRHIGISTSDCAGWLSLLIARGKRSILSQRRPSRACVDDRSGTISGSLRGAVADLGAEEVHVSTSIMATARSTAPVRSFRYLAEFSGYFKRCFDLKSMFRPLAFASTNAAPQRYASVHVLYKFG